MARFSGGYRASDGWVDVYDCGLPQSGLRRPAHSRHGNNTSARLQDGTLGGYERADGRAQLRWLPTSGIENNLTFDYMDDHSDATTDVTRRRAAFHLRESDDGRRQWRHRCAAGPDAGRPFRRARSAMASRCGSTTSAARSTTFR